MSVLEMLSRVALTYLPELGVEYALAMSMYSLMDTAVGMVGNDVI